MKKMKQCIIVLFVFIIPLFVLSGTKQLKFLSYWDSELQTSGVEAFGFYYQMIYHYNKKFGAPPTNADYIYTKGYLKKTYDNTLYYGADRKEILYMVAHGSPAGLGYVGWNYIGLGDGNVGCDWVISVSCNTLYWDDTSNPFYGGNCPLKRLWDSTYNLNGLKGGDVFKGLHGINGMRSQIHVGWWEPLEELELFGSGNSTKRSRDFVNYLYIGYDMGTAWWLAEVNNDDNIEVAGVGVGYNGHIYYQETLNNYNSDPPPDNYSSGKPWSMYLWSGVKGNPVY